ncbi:right-handed parallel beta-helix repeat-containing protein [Nocardioides stalactiti]|uniref:right-handed parallel beta-helix repeat-containing protein n=1 Tax=Nocardioides stalactiti TaxID=2755356 RepID=UPI001601EB7A|nr:right-handed parallel beta-helix repeat-containing protein [Nocardioides stalactiti]
MSADVLELIVTVAADRGPGSLRDAIERANRAAGPVRIRIAPAGPMTICPSTPLPALQFSGHLEGPGRLDGTRSAPGCGLEAAADDLTLRGLEVTGWAGSGIRVTGRHCTIRGVVASGNGDYGILIDEGADHARIEGCRLGTDPTGTSAAPNQKSGIRVIQAKDAVIGGNSPGERNVLSGNVLYGVEIVGPLASGAVVRGNYVGLDAAGTSAVGNQRTGVLVFNVPSTTVGGTGPGDGNVISGNGRSGVTVDGMDIERGEYPYVGQGHCQGTQLRGNLIGLDRSGERPLGNGMRGVTINYAQAATVADNVISGNRQDGIWVLGPDDDTNPHEVPRGNRIVRNRIGITRKGAAAGNARAGILVLNGRDNVVGSHDPDDANLIAHNGSVGVMFTGLGARTNRLSPHNEIVDNSLGRFHQPAEMKDSGAGDHGHHDG